MGGKGRREGGGEERGGWGAWPVLATRALGLAVTRAVRRAVGRAAVCADVPFIALVNSSYSSMSVSTAVL